MSVSKRTVWISSPNPLDKLYPTNYIGTCPFGFICGLSFSKDKHFVFGLGLGFPGERDASFGYDRAPWHRSLYGELVCGIWRANFNGLHNNDSNGHGAHTDLGHTRRTCIASKRVIFSES